MYTTDDVARLLEDLGVEMAKRHAALMHPAVVVAPMYVAGAKNGVVAVDKAAADKAAADPAVKAHADMLDMAGLEKKHSPAVEFEKSQFGLAVEMWDHVSDKFLWLCKPAKDGQAEVFMTVKAVEDKLAEWRKPIIEKHKADVAKQRAADVAAKKAADEAAAKASGAPAAPAPPPPPPPPAVAKV